MALAVLLLSGAGFLPYVDAQTKYLSYENKQYGFSIKYPSNWQKAETLSSSDNFPNVLEIVTFSSPSDLTSYSVSLIKDDTTFKGLSGQKFSNKIKEKFVNVFCSAAPPDVICSTKILQQKTLTHQNGYSGYLTMFDLNISTGQESVKLGIVLGFYPDGSDVWIIAVASYSADELQKYTNELSTMGSSFTIFSYDGEQTTSQTTSQPSTIAKSGVGTLQINSGYFAASKYKPAELIVSGEIKNYLQGVPLTLKIVKPDKTTTEQNILVTKDGKFKTPVKLDENWPAGSYRIIAKYGSADLGEVSFQVNTGDAKATTTQQQTTTASQSKKYLTYENKKYGISLKYPSDWQKEETLEKDETYPEIMNIVEFQSPSGEANFNVGIIQDDKGTSQKILDETKKSATKDELCSSVPAEANCSVEITEKRLTHKNGYDMRVTTLLIKMTYLKELIELPATLTIVPDGKNTWLIGTTAFSFTDSNQLLKEVSSISESLKISNYKGSTQSSIITEPSTSASSQKQFSLNVKAIQENDLVTITISSPPNLASDVYGIKLTTTTGKIKNYVKVNGWDHKRISDNTVSYQTKSSPLEKSDVIKIKLKVDAKKPEIKWDAFSKDQKSLGTGKVKP